MKFLTLFTRYIFLGALVLATLPAQAQVPERDQLQKEFEAFRQQTNARFNNFRDSVDRAFVRFMRDSWKDFAVYAGNPSPLSPDKPPRQPNAPETPPKSATPDRPGTEISGTVVASEKTPDDEADFRPAPPDREGETVSEAIYRTADIGFYGLNLPLRYDLGMVLKLSRPFNKSIPDGWEVLASTDYNALIMQLVTVSDKTRLNDWGYVQLVRKMAAALYPAQYNEQVLFTCFILNKSGYLAKIGFNRQALFLLLPSPQEVYNTPYLAIENLRYYVYSFNPDYGHVASIKTYEGQYGDSRHAVNFAFKNPIHLPKNIQTRAVRLSKDARKPLKFNTIKISWTSIRTCRRRGLP
ncbi:MAG: hypothetical protein D6714_21270 [Bacteroidetes bacterium]|nr:MAG: hypothetical protein D6714_21270 [Bacteroidota bacterium]